MATQTCNMCGRYGSGMEVRMRADGKHYHKDCWTDHEEMKSFRPSIPLQRPVSNGWYAVTAYPGLFKRVLQTKIEWCMEGAHDRRSVSSYQNNAGYNACGYGLFRYVVTKKQDGTVYTYWCCSTSCE